MNLGSDGFREEFFQPFKELTPSLHNFFQKIEEEGLVPIYFTKLVLPRYNHRDSTQKIKTNSQNYRSTSLINIDRKMVTKATAHRDHWRGFIKRIVRYGQVGEVRDVRLVQLKKVMKSTVLTGQRGRITPAHQLMQKTLLTKFTTCSW